MTKDQAAQYAKEHLRDYLEAHGIRPSRPFRCLNPEHPDRNPSMSYDSKREKVHCFACGADYDTIDLIGIDRGLTDYPAKLEAAAAFFNLQIDGAGTAPRRTTSTRPQPPRAAADQHQQPRPALEPEPEADYTEFITQAAANIENLGEIRETGRYRGIFLDTLKKYRVGYVENYRGDNRAAQGWNCVIIPTGNGASSYTIRNADRSAAARYRNQGKAGLFNAAALYDTEWKWPVFITEGEIDALSVLQTGAAAVGLGSADNAGLLLDAIREKPPLHPLILAIDNDEKGRKATAELIEGKNGKPGLKQLAIPYFVRNISGGHKDENEALVEDGLEAFAPAIATAIQDTEEEIKRAEMERQQRTGAGMVDTFLDEIRTQRYKPIPTGIADIDKALGGGFIRQQLILLGAAPGTGKTALAQWIFEGMAKSGRASCLYLNLEMSREQILARSFSRILAGKGFTMKPTEILQGYAWNPQQEDYILRAAEEYKQTIAPRMIYNPDGITANLDTILEYIEREATAAERAGLPAPCIVIDYLQIITGAEREDDAAIIKRAVSSLKGIAVKHNTVVFVIIAHNREANKSGTVTMTSGRDTSALEYSADLQLGLAFTLCMNRPGQTTKNPEELTREERQQLTLKVTKGRFAAPGTEVDLIFNGETMTMTQKAKQYQAPPQQPRAGRRL